jgi:DnaJ-class molecular chaperone
MSTLEDGKAQVDIPTGIQPDTVPRLRNKGLPRYGGKAKDDLYLPIKVRVPEKLDREARALYEWLHAPAGKPKRKDEHESNAGGGIFGSAAHQGSALTDASTT